MSTQPRNQSLDYQRGIACMFMVIAHLRLADPSNQWTSWVSYISGLATLLFFAVSGFNSWQQAHKYPLRFIAASQCTLFLFGVTYSSILFVDQYHRFSMEIFQIIATGSLLVALVHRWLSLPVWAYLLIAILIVALKAYVDVIAPQFDGGGVILPRSDYVPHDQLAAGQTKIFPGFPLLPWLYAFFLGVFLGKASNRVLFLIVIAVAIALLVTTYLNVGGNVREKWDTTPNYVLACVIFTAAIALLSNQLKPGSDRNILLYMGRNSLLFFFVHPLGLMLGTVLSNVSQVLAWAVAIVVTYIAMKLFDRWRGLRIFELPTTWWFLLAGVCALPLLVLITPATSGIVRLGEYVMGLLFAKHYPQLRKLLLQRFGNPVQA